MERNIQKNGFINLLTLLVVGAAGFAVSRFSNSPAGQVSTVFAGIGALVTIVSWFQARLEDHERSEKLDLDELARRKGAASLFEARAADGFPAHPSRQQFA